MNQITLHTGSLRLTFSAESGALIGMEAPGTGWVMHKRPELGLSWRLLVPMHEELRNNPVYGEKQTLSRYTVSENAVRFEWDQVLSERAGALAIRVIQEIKAEGPQAVWYTHIENNSPYVVESVYSPYLGDLKPAADAEHLRSLHWGYSSSWEWNLWPRFSMTEGDHSVDYPTQFAPAAPQDPFCLIHDQKQGLYCGVKSDSCEMVAWHGELRPGYDSAIDGRVPEQEEIAGKPVHTRFSSVHMCYIQPGCAEDLTPIAMEAYVGDWHTGVDIYRAWRDTVSPTILPPAWARDPHSWLQLHINSPEDELRMRFTDLPKVAEECAKYGVKAIQLVGWNDGGQDQGNPSHTPDPRLGTFEELKQAIADCKAFGVKLILFAKFTWADRGTRWFREELKELAVTDPYGDYYQHPGYEYQTPAQLLDINTKRLIPMCFGSERYMEICRQEFQKLVDLGADGMLFDECFHHQPSQLCFHPDHGHKYGWPVYQNDRKFVEMLRQTPGLPPDFMMAGESCYDWELEQYELSYFRSRSKGHAPMSRYMRPDAQLMTAVSGFNDRNMIDQCLLYRYVISYEPYNFKGWLHDYPDTVAYGQKMDALRTQYRKYFWDGEFRDTCGAVVTDLAGKAHHPYARYEAEDGTSGLVICNYEDSEVVLKAALENGTLTKYRTVDEEVWYPAAEEIRIPARSAVIVL